MSVGWTHKGILEDAVFNCPVFIQLLAFLHRSNLDDTSTPALLNSLPFRLDLIHFRPLGGYIQ